MTINSKQPTITDFKKNEVRTLEYINARSTILKEFPDLITKIERSYYDNKLLLTKPTGDFIFHADFDMDVEGSQHKIIIGANVTGNYAMCSYFLAIVGKDNFSNEIIRKFHFDYAIPPKSPVKQPSPVYHLQYGGKPSPEMAILGVSDTYMEHWLSLPRLHFAPMNIALLLDTLFCEFRTNQTKKVIEDDDWRALVYANEKFLSNHYFENINNHIISRNYKKDSLVRDYCYNT